jgi:DNA-binding GntR family transcriptional regulator
MNYIQLDKTLKMSISEQIKQSVLAALSTGQLKHNDRLPFEEDIAAYYHISRLMVRNAYDELEKLGLLKRVKRLGTFIQLTPHYVFSNTDLPRMPRFETLELNQSLNISSQLLVREVLRKAKFVPSVLASSTYTWLRQVDVFYDQENPLVVIERFVPSTLLMDLNDHSNVFELREALESKLFIRNITIRSDFRLEHASTLLEQTLDTSNQRVLFVQTYTLLNQAEQPVAMMNLSFDATRVSITFRGPA